MKMLNLKKNDLLLSKNGRHEILKGPKFEKTQSIMANVSPYAGVGLHHQLMPHAQAGSQVWCTTCQLRRNQIGDRAISIA